MARPKKQTSNQPVWAICICYSDNTCGWLLNEDLDVKTYSTQEEAEKALKQMKRNPHYSWSFPMEARVFTGFSDRKE